MSDNEIYQFMVHAGSDTLVIYGDELDVRSDGLWIFLDDQPVAFVPMLELKHVRNMTLDAEAKGRQHVVDECGNPFGPPIYDI